jgi:hypothetical protein
LSLANRPNNQEIGQGSERRGSTEELADASAHQSEQKNRQSKSGTEQAADKMGDEVYALTDVLDHRTEYSGEGIRLMHTNQEARIGNSDRWWSAGRKNRAGGTGVLMGSLYEWIRWH